MRFWICYTLPIQKKIHTCLSTTGHGITRETLGELDGYLDQLLISIPTLEKNEWLDFFKNRKNSSQLFENVIGILNSISETGIILEVCSVITRENKDTIFRVGERLAKMNPNIIWKLEYYYPMGIYKNKKDKFEIEFNELTEIRSSLNKTFGATFRELYITEPIRHNAPNIFVTPSGEMVKTSGNDYSESIGNILKDYRNVDFQMNRPWSEYKKYCRDWNW